MADELSNVGAPVSDEQIEDRILSTLPPSFHGARAAWETLPSGEHRNLIRLTARMVLEETRNKALPGGGNNPVWHSLLHTRARYRNQLMKILKLHLQPMVITEEAIVEEDIEEEAIVEMVAKEEVADTEDTDEEKDIAAMEVTEEIIKEEEATIKDLNHHLVHMIATNVENRVI